MSRTATIPSVAPTTPTLRHRPGDPRLYDQLHMQPAAVPDADQRRLAPLGPIRRTIREVGFALITARVGVLLFVGYQLWGTGFAERSSQNKLRKEFNAQIALPPLTTSTTPATAAATTSTSPGTSASTSTSTSTTVPVS